ncbi:uncharacterized protein LOC135215391 [Macrobrachium nipponense]|uniref:uncharacterized protein LOC135215391 n=1 Tax=Macrobrachium nipponense TaxID=159736 RepID=UPI0030C7DD6F
MFGINSRTTINEDEIQSELIQNGSQGRQSRSHSIQARDSKNDGNNGTQVRDNEDDEVASLLRSKSTLSLPIRSLSPFRDARPPTNSLNDDNGVSTSRSSTPELTMEPLEEDKEEEEEEELGKDLFQLQFRKSLLKALSSFSESSEKSKSFLAAKDADLPHTSLADHKGTESQKIQKISVVSKKSKAKKRKTKHLAEEVFDQNLISKEVCETRVKRKMITRSSAANFVKDSTDHSTYLNISQSKINIFKAAEDGDLGAVLGLLPHTGPSIRKGKRRQSLLHVSAARGQSDVVMHLLNLISPNTVNKDGQTPAHLAAMNGHTHILKIMFTDKEFDPDLEDNWQRTFRDLLVAPLFEASLLGNKRKIEVLLELGANPDYHAGKLVEGILSRELKVTTARQLAAAIYGEPFIRVYSKKRKDSVNGLKVTFTRMPKPNSKKLNSLQPCVPTMFLV